MENEVRCKLLARNLWCLIQEEHELVINTVFWTAGTATGLTVAELN